MRKNAAAVMSGAAKIKKENLLKKRLTKIAFGVTIKP